MEWFSLVLLACVLSAVASVVGTTYFFLRPNGALERLDNGRASQAKLALEYCEDFKIRMAGHAAEVQAAKALVTTNLDAMQSRMSSFESRYGKMTRKDELERQREEVFELMRQQQNGVKTNES